MLANLSTWALERPVASASLARAEGVVLAASSVSVSLTPASRNFLPVTSPMPSMSSIL